MDISSVSRLLGRMRRVATFFHSSSTATHILEEKQRALQLPEHKLIQDVRTRWNSSFDMMNRYWEQQPEIFATFLHKDIKKNIKDVVTLYEAEVSEAEDLVQILGPLKKITTILCSEHAPTISLVHPIREMLLQEMARNSSTSQMATKASYLILRFSHMRKKCFISSKVIWNATCLEYVCEFLERTLEFVVDELLNSNFKWIARLQCPVTCFYSLVPTKWSGK